MKSTLVLLALLGTFAACKTTTTGEGTSTSSSGFSGTSSSGSSSSGGGSSGSTTSSSGVSGTSTSSSGSVSNAQCQSTCFSKLNECNPDHPDKFAACQDLCSGTSYTQSQLT